MQQEAIGKSFIGAKVRWLLNLNSVRSLSGDQIQADFAEGTMAQQIDRIRKGGRFGIVLCSRISEEDKNALRLSEKDAPFYVSGTILTCDPIEITLSDCKLAPYSADTPIK